MRFNGRKRSRSTGSRPARSHGGGGTVRLFVGERRAAGPHRAALNAPDIDLDRGYALAQACSATPRSNGRARACCRSRSVVPPWQASRSGRGRCHALRPPGGSRSSALRSAISQRGARSGTHRHARIVPERDGHARPRCTRSTAWRRCWRNSLRRRPPVSPPGRALRPAKIRATLAVNAEPARPAGSPVIAALKLEGSAGTLDQPARQGGWRRRRVRAWNLSRLGDQDESHRDARGRRRQRSSSSSGWISSLPSTSARAAGLTAKRTVRRRDGGRQPARGGRPRRCDQGNGAAFRTAGSDRRSHHQGRECEGPQPAAGAAGRAGETLSVALTGRLALAEGGGAQRRCRQSRGDSYRRPAQDRLAPTARVGAGVDRRWRDRARRDQPSGGDRGCHRTPSGSAGAATSGLPIPSSRGCLDVSAVASW